ncbi:MAG: hypothetical protein K2Q27_01960 [Novosphingobium sp.]|nr:hypothetical protein [Novosphingobium sp.]
MLAAGTISSYIGNQQAKNATRNQLALENQRQASKTREQEQALDQSYQAAGKLKDPNAQQAASDKRRQAFVAALNARPENSGYLPGQESAPKVVADAADQSAARQNAYSEGQAGALADLTSQGDLLQNANIDIGRAGQTIGQLGRDKYNSANALNAELNAARFKGGTLRGLGGLAQTIGMAALGSKLGGLNAGKYGSLNSVMEGTSLGKPVFTGIIDAGTPTIPPGFKPMVIS